VNCPFCEEAAAENHLAETSLSFAFPDRYPVAPGHLLVAPLRHEADFRNLTSEEQADALMLAARLASESQSEGVNVGINIGEPAGQTIPHVHIHVIPRVRGDVQDPRGGVRWVIPERAPYWDDLDRD
jgi:diadenosine tetraphosphate (Ap4A) HIT family hydrolase